MIKFLQFAKDSVKIPKILQPKSKSSSGKLQGKGSSVKFDGKTFHGFSTYRVVGRTLLINDRAYGEFEIDDPQVLRIFQTKIFQKTLNITQHGVPGLIGWSQPVSRGEHMIGSYLLVRSLTNNREEQYAALIHDITHRTFSHLIDVVFRDTLKGQSLHELNVFDFVKNTDLQSALEPPLSTKRLLDSKNFSILEQNPPALCADRGDYSPRDLIALGLAEKEFTMRYFADLGLTPDGRMYLKSLDVARRFAQKCIELDQVFYGSLRNIGLNQLSARLIRYGLESHIIAKEDFDTKTCWQVWEKLRGSANENLDKLFRIIDQEMRFIKNKQPDSQFRMRIRSPEEPKAEEISGFFSVAEKIKCKPRCIDPLVKIGDRFEGLSKADMEFAKLYEAHKKDATKTVDVYCKSEE